MSREAGIISAEIGASENRQLAEALVSVGLTPRSFSLDGVATCTGLTRSFLHADVALDDIPGFIVRGIGHTTWNKAFYRLDVLYALESRGKILVNSAFSVENATDKMRSSVILDAKGIPTPRTVMAEDPKQAIAAFDLLGGDVVVKPVYGSQGTGMFRINEKGYAERVILEMFQQGFVFYIQEFHPWSNPPDFRMRAPFDARLFVVGGRVVASMLRVGQAGSWKTNVHQGATPVKFDPTPELQELAIKSAESLHLEIAGIDVLYSSKISGWTVLEVNGTPGWTGLARVTEANIPKDIALHFKERIRA